jgi:hypothetical protein
MTSQISPGHQMSHPLTECRHPEVLSECGCLHNIECIHFKEYLFLFNDFQPLWGCKHEGLQELQRRQHENEIAGSTVSAGGGWGWGVLAGRQGARRLSRVEGTPHSSTWSCLPHGLSYGCSGDCCFILTQLQF